MAYSPFYGTPGTGTGWENAIGGGTPITGAALDNMESGIIAAQSTADAAAAILPRLAQSDYAKLLPWFAALANRANARANVVLMGASIVEGFPVATFARTIGQSMATLLRSRFPTAGATGGRGYIGIPTAVTASAGWPLVFTGGTFDDSTFDFGAKHRIWYASAAGKWVDTLAAPITSFDINLYLGTAGSATGGYYKIDGGAPVAFNTLAGSTQLQALHVASPATTSVEVGWNGAGTIVSDGITEYNGDESAGITVHNCGHASYSTAQWAVTGGASPSWLQSVAALSPAVLILQDFGVNDAYTGNGNRSATQFKSDMVAFIAQLRAGAITCPLVLAADYDTSGGITLVQPWSNYVTAMQQIAAADGTVLFLDHSARMPSTGAASQYSLYATDHLHGNPNGSAYQMMAETNVRAISPY